MKLQVDGDFARAGRSHNLVGVFVFVELRSPVKPGMTCKLDMTMLFPDALSCNVQIINKIGLKFQQNLFKVDTNIVLYQYLVKDTILQIQIDIVLYQVLFWSKYRHSYLLIFVLIFCYQHTVVCIISRCNVFLILAFSNAAVQMKTLSGEDVLRALWLIWCKR